MNHLENICVFCGSSDRISNSYHQSAVDMGHSIAAKGYSLVYGGGSTGLMGTLANAVLETGGRVIGVIPKAFDNSTLAHHGLSESHVVDTMHERKAKMVELADGFIALPGGFGTFDELFEVITYAQVGIHHCPIGLLNTDGYFEPCLRLIEHAENEGFIYVEHQELIVHSSDPMDLLQRLVEYRSPEGLERWVEREEEEE